jgi:hypothetical protein
LLPVEAPHVIHDFDKTGKMARCAHSATRFIPNLYALFADSKWLLLHIGMVGLPFVQCFYLIIGALYLFIPIMGRAGAGSHAEFLIAIMVSIMFTFLFSFAVPLILLVRSIERIFSLLIGLFLLSLAVLILTPLGFPYSGEPTSLAPQRFMIAVSEKIAQYRSKMRSQTVAIYTFNPTCSLNLTNCQKVSLIPVANLFPTRGQVVSVILYVFAALQTDFP